MGPAVAREEASAGSGIAPALPMGITGLGAPIADAQTIKEEPEPDTVVPEATAADPGMNQVSAAGDEAQPDIASTAAVEADRHDSDDESAGSSEGPGSSIDHGSTSVHDSSTVPVQDTALTEATTEERPTPVKRPSLYSQVSRSMIDLSTASKANMPSPVTEEAPTGLDGAPAIPPGTVKPGLTTIPSGQEIPTQSDGTGPSGRSAVQPSRIEIPARQRHPLMSGLPTPGEWARPPPTPAAALTNGNAAGFSWGGSGARGKEGDKAVLKRRRSADDVSMPPPGYEPPFPGTFIPRPRDEEGREKLPAYWCAVGRAAHRR